VAAALAAMLLTAPLHADTGPPSTHAPLDLRYTMTYAGLHVAELALTMQPAAGRTQSELAVRGEGLIGLFSRSFTRMTAISTAGTLPQPRHLQASYHKRDRDREVTMRWDARGDVVEAVEVRNGRKRPSEVPQADRVGTLDPLTAVLRLRDWLAAPRTTTGAELRLAVTDGRKRVDMLARRNADVTDADGSRLHSLTVQLLPVFGFEEGDGLVSWPGQPARLYEVLVSSDGAYAPVAVRENGSPLIVVSRDCRSDPGCEPLREP
jgi:hypothetical protein